MTAWKERISVGLPRAMVVAHDLCMVWLAWIGLHQFRYAMLSTSPGVGLWSTEIALVLMAQGLVFWRVGLYRGIWRFASVPDLFNILKASVFGWLRSCSACSSITGSTWCRARCWCCIRSC